MNVKILNANSIRFFMLDFQVCDEAASNLWPQTPWIFEGQDQVGKSLKPKVETASVSSAWSMSASARVNSRAIDPGLKSGYLRQYSSSISVSSWSSKGCRRPRLFPLLVGDWGCGGWWGCCRGWWCWAVAPVTKILVCMVCTSYLKHNNSFYLVITDQEFEL